MLRNVLSGTPFLNEEINDPNKFAKLLLCPFWWIVDLLEVWEGGRGNEGGGGGGVAQWFFSDFAPLAAH